MNSDRWHLLFRLALAIASIDQCLGASVVVQVANGTASGTHLSAVTKEGLYVEFILPDGHKDGAPVVVQYEPPSSPGGLKSPHPKTLNDDAVMIHGHDGHDANNAELLEMLVEHPEEKRESSLLFHVPTPEPTPCPTSAPTYGFLSIHHRLDEVSAWYKYLEKELRRKTQIYSTDHAKVSQEAHVVPIVSLEKPRWWIVDCGNIGDVLQERSSTANSNNPPTGDVFEEARHTVDSRFGGMMVTRQAALVIDTASLSSASNLQATESSKPQPVLVSTHIFDNAYDIFAEVSSAEYLRGRYGVPKLLGVCIAKNVIDQTKHQVTYVYEDLCHQGIGGEKWHNAFKIDLATGKANFAAAAVAASGSSGVNGTSPSHAPFAAFRLATRIAHFFQEVSEISHGFIRDLGPHSFCVYRSHTSLDVAQKRGRIKTSTAWQYLRRSGAAHEPWEEYHHRPTLLSQSEPSQTTENRKKMHEQQRLKNVVTRHNSHFPASHPANFAFEIALRDPLRGVLFFDGPLASKVSARFLTQKIPCRWGCGVDAVDDPTHDALDKYKAKLYGVTPLRFVPGCSVEESRARDSSCAASPEAKGRCNKKTLRCVAGTSATHVYDVGKLPWLYPSLVGHLPRLKDIVDLMTAQDPNVRPSFSRVRYLLGCLRKTPALSRHSKSKGIFGHNTKAYSSCMKTSRTFYLHERDVAQKRKGAFAAPVQQYFQREINALKAALVLEPIPTKRNETLMKIAEYEERAKKMSQISQIRR